MCTAARRTEKVELKSEMVKQKKTILTAVSPWVVPFGQRLERARGRVGLTQAKLAGSELSKSFVSLLETARSTPSVETLLLLARRTGTSVAGLLLDSAELRLDTALSLISLARGAVLSRPAWVRNVISTVEELVPDTPLWLKAEILTIRALASAAENRLKEAERLAQQARRYAEQAGFGPGKAEALAILGHVALVRREFVEAFRLLGQAVEQYRESGALRSESGVRTLIWLGTASVKVGREKYARRIYEKARTLASRLNIQGLEGRALWGLGHLAWTEGDHGRATSLMLEARSAFEESEDLIDLSELMTNLGGLYREQGKLEQSLAAVQQSVRVIERLGNVRRRSAAYQEMARLYLQLGKLDEAQKAARQALQDANSVDDRQHRALSLAALGRVAAAQGQRNRAIRHLREATRLLKVLGLTAAWAEASRDLALLRQPATPAAEAEQYLAQAFGSRQPLVSSGQDAARPRPRQGRRPTPSSR
jgi:tetratricopeptide (TPR) repeat protein